MSQMAVGKVGWIDNTAENAGDLRKFYEAVIGWESEPVPVEDHEDFNMTVNGEPQAGICHRVGVNADVPPGWMVYFVVADLDASLQAVVAQGGSVIADRREGSGPGFAYIKDPGGAVCALFQHGKA